MNQARVTPTNTYSGHSGLALGFDHGSVVLGDGTRIEVDVVVVATGFKSSSVLAESIMGKELSAKIGEVGALDGEGERIAVSVTSCGFLVFC